MGKTKVQQQSGELKNKNYRSAAKGHYCKPLVPINIDPATKQLIAILTDIIKTTKNTDERVQARAKLKELNKAQEKSMDWKTAKYIGNGDVSQVFQAMRNTRTNKKLLVLNQKQLDLDALIIRINELEYKVANSTVKARVKEAKKQLKELNKQYENWSN